MKELFVMLAFFLVCGVTSQEFPSCAENQPLEDNCECGASICFKGYKCIDDGEANTGCVTNSCTDFNNPLGHSCFCGIYLCEIGSVCFNGVCTTPTTNPGISSSTPPTTNPETSSSTTPTTNPGTSSSTPPTTNPETSSTTPEEESITKKIVKTFLVGLTIALPLGLVLYLMFKL